jgi:hypothetical protein
MKNTGIPKYKIGQWVKFRTGKRTLRGCIVGWYLNSADAVIYQIARNKQTFRMIYESAIIELSP